jgi:hypothetical protein
MIAGVARELGVDQTLGNWCAKNASTAASAR